MRRCRAMTRRARLIPTAINVDRHPEAAADPPSLAMRATAGLSPPKRGARRRKAALEGYCSSANRNRLCRFRKCLVPKSATADLGCRRPSRLAPLAPQGDGYESSEIAAGMRHSAPQKNCQATSSGLASRQLVAVTAAETADAAADGSAIRRARPCGGRSIAPFPNHTVTLRRSRDPRPGF